MFCVVLYKGCKEGGHFRGIPALLLNWSYLIYKTRYLIHGTNSPVCVLTDRKEFRVISICRDTIAVNLSTIQTMSEPR
jgi:hypothetical protein